MQLVRFASLATAVLVSSAAWAGHRPLQEWKYATSDNQVFSNTQYHISNVGRRTGVDASNNLFIVTTRSATTPCMVVVKVGGDTGAPLWRRDLCGGDGESLAVDAAGDVIVTGIQNSAGYVAKLAGGDGHTIWSYAPATGNKAAVAVALDGAGNPIVASQDGDNIVVNKLANATGAVAWTSRESTPGLSFALTEGGFVAFAVNASGAAAYSYLVQNPDQSTSRFTSSIDATGTRRWTVPGGNVQAVFANGDVYDGTNRRAAADGAVLWTGTPLARAILDPNENILGVQVIVDSQAVFAQHLVAMRLSPTTGSTAWSRSLQQPNVQQLTPDLAVSLGTFIITNSPSLTVNGQSRLGLQITELDAFDGTLLYNTIDANPNIKVSARELAVGAAAFLTGTTGSYPNFEVGSVAYFMADSRNAVDFNADDRGDLTWRHNGDNQVGVWLMNGTSPVGGASFTGPPGAVVDKVADFDGDGQSDLLWRGPRGEYYISLMSGPNVRSTTQIYDGTSGWQVVGTGDFDNDRHADLLWKHPTQGYAMWLMNGATPVGGGSVTMPGAGFDVALFGDFNRDGRTDLVWTHPDGRVVVTLLFGPGGNNFQQIMGPSTGWVPVALGDFNGDGKADIVWRHADGSYALWLMDGQTPRYGASLRGANSGWTLAMVADFDRDGSSDILWRNGAGTIEGWRMATDFVLESTTLYPGGSWTPVAHGDFNADSRDDILWRNANGEYGTWLMNGLTPTAAASILPAGTGWELSP